VTFATWVKLSKDVSSEKHTEINHIGVETFQTCFALLSAVVCGAIDAFELHFFHHNTEF
jgi:hypothetical protein